MNASSINTGAFLCASSLLSLTRANPAPVNTSLSIAEQVNRATVTQYTMAASMPCITVGDWKMYHLPNGELEARFLHACLFSRKVRLVRCWVPKRNLLLLLLS